MLIDRVQFSFVSPAVAMRWLLVGILLQFLVATATAQSIYQIPSPRADGKQGWIVDQTGKISPEAVQHVNLICEEVHQKLNKELCVVVVNSTGGQEVRQFGTLLFNHWGIGKWGFGGTFRNDGILLIAALEDRRAAIVLGQGIDDDRQVRTSQQIIDDVVIPNFAAGDSGSALYEGIRSCATRLLAVADLDSPEMLPSVSASGGGVRAKVRQQQRKGLWPWMPWILGASGIGGVLALIGGRQYWRYRSRYCPKCKQAMALLSEAQDDQYLKDPEVVEERLGSVNYDVWACLPCNEVLKVRYGRFFTRYSKCPKCWYITVFRIERILVPATYSSGGTVRVMEECKSCSFNRTFTYSTPKRVRHTSSSGGFGGGGGGGGGSSSSGFGGGSSSGRGASGGW